MESPPILDDIAAVNRINSLPVILEAVAALTGMRVTFVARVTPTSWTACSVVDRMNFGLNVGDNLDVATTLCKEVHDNNKAIVIEHASQDADYCTHKTPKLYKIESYIALPIYREDGSVFGTLCAIDSEPAQLPPKVVNSLSLFAELISKQLKMEETLAQTESQLAQEQALGKLREEFIAILGHDLRSPLTNITLASKLLTEILSDPDHVELAESSYESSMHINRMIEDLLDFSRCRLTNDLASEARESTNPQDIVKAVVAEQKATHPARRVNLQTNIDTTAHLNPTRFRQVVTNLLGNALTHSPKEEEVEISLELVGQNLRLKVRNGGPAIPASEQSRLFQPFSKGVKSQGKGLGLGLYICSEIARAHEGSLHLESSDRGTVFTLLLPVKNS